MISHPSASELVQSVGLWLEQIRPTLDPRNAFLARVAGNALSAVGRELESGPRAEAAASARFAELLGHDGAWAELNAEVCARIGAGELTVETPGLLAALKANTLEQLAIDQPSYRHEGLAQGG